MRALNCGSGQRPFDNKLGWINLDISPKENPDVIGDWNDLSAFGDASMDYVVNHHSAEHVGCNEALPFLNESFRVLKPGGSLLIFVPDMRALAMRWLSGQLDTQIYFTNVYGPFDGTEGSRHRWGYDKVTLALFLAQCPWYLVRSFDWRVIPGASPARDWHILAMEAVK